MLREKRRVKMLDIICMLIVIFLFPCITNAKEIYMGPSESLKSLKEAFSAMTSGDTLIIRDGTYTGADNVINSSQYPPPGISKSQPTVIKAENTGKVFFDGQSSQQMFYFLGRSGGTSYLHYWKFEGIQWIRSSSYAIELTSGTGSSDFTTSDFNSDLPDAYIQFKSCGFHGEGNSVQTAYIKQVLFEDCWTWGNGRYGYNFYLCDNVVVRRNVDRRDACKGTSLPTASYINYASHHVSFLNCISIDVDSNLWDSDRDPYGGFYCRNSYSGRRSEDTKYMGCIVLNFDSSANSPYMAGWYVQADPVDTVISNCIVWGSSKGFLVSKLVDDVTITNCTVGGSENQTGGSLHYAYADVSQSGTDYLDVTNSVAYNNSFLTARSYISNTSDYNNFYGNANDSSSGTHDLHDDPNYLYITRVEGDSPNYKSGSDGSSRGAVVLKKYGYDGTFYGDDGYDALTSNDLWPWANEQEIKSSFGLDYGRTNEKRGFCADSYQLNGTDKITLTSYIWEYLGHPVPAEYNSTIVQNLSAPLDFKIIEQ